jgi:Putative zinc-finger
VGDSALKNRRIVKNPPPLRVVFERFHAKIESVGVTHISAEAVELYALGRLSDEEVAIVEEHLLVCEQCQQALALEDATIESIREALRKR